jgi:hypothetical protein
MARSAVCGPPRSRTVRIISPKPVASAHAPWTNTIVGVFAVIVVTKPSLRDWATATGYDGTRCAGLPIAGIPFASGGSASRVNLDLLNGVGQGVVRADGDYDDGSPRHEAAWSGDGRGPGAPWLVGTGEVGTGSRSVDRGELETSV